MMSRSSLAVAALAGMALVVSACGGESVSALELGREAEVQTGDAGAPDRAPTTLGVTVLDVREGTMDDLAAGGYEVDEEDLSKTPIYVDVRYENKGDETITRELRTSLEDQDGNLITAVTIFNYGGQPFETCTDNTEGELAPGESFESCVLHFAPEGREPTRVSFLPYVPGEETDWVYWQIPR
jgi:hypothetical protein